MIDYVLYGNLAVTFLSNDGLNSLAVSAQSAMVLLGDFGIPFTDYTTHDALGWFVCTFGPNECVEEEEVEEDDEEPEEEAVYVPEDDAQAQETANAEQDGAEQQDVSSESDSETAEEPTE